jgi:hypothetical protein
MTKIDCDHAFKLNPRLWFSSVSIKVNINVTQFQSIPFSIDQYPSIDQSINRSITQSINQSIKQSINMALTKAKMNKRYRGQLH